MKTSNINFISGDITIFDDLILKEVRIYYCAVMPLSDLAVIILAMQLARK